MEKSLKKIQKLQKIRIILNLFQPIFPFTFFRDICDKKKLKLVNSILDNLIENTGLINQYTSFDVSKLNKIGNTIWIFWYSGFETAPFLVKKCVEIAKSLNNANVVLIDKNNLEDYFEFEGNIKYLFENKKISIQTFSDILRIQLLSRKGGFWFDATLFATRQDFILNHENLTYFSIKHSKNDLLLKKKWNEFFTEGKWSTYCCGSGIGNPLFSFIYDTYISYYKEYNCAFDYFQTDYIWLYAYTHFSWAKEMIDSVFPCVDCSYNFHHKLLRKFNEDDWNKTIVNNEFQKLGWRAVTPKKLNKIKNRKYETYYDHFLSFHF